MAGRCNKYLNRTRASLTIGVGVSTRHPRKNHLVFDIGNTTFRMETAFGQYRSVDAQLGQLWHYYNKTGILATGDSLLEPYQALL